MSKTLGELLKEKFEEADRKAGVVRVIRLPSVNHFYPEDHFLDSQICVIGGSNPCNEISLSQRSNNMDVQKLINLADPSWKKDMEDLGLVSNSVDGDELTAELQRQIEEDRSKAVKQAATEILALGRRKQSYLNQRLLELREVRAQEKRILVDMKSIEEAWVYGQKTRNYIPLGLKVGSISFFQVQGMDSALLKVQPLPAEAKPEAKPEAK